MVVHNGWGILCVLLSASVLSFLFPFATYHVRIRSQGLTTFENLKNIYGDLPSPYHEGLVCNFWTICCTSQVPSLVQDMHIKLTTRDYVEKYVDPLGRYHHIYNRYVNPIVAKIEGDHSELSFMRDAGSGRYNAVSV